MERLLKLSANLPTKGTQFAQAERQGNLRRVSDTEPWLARGVVFLDGPRGLALREQVGEFGLRRAAAEAIPASGVVTKPATRDITQAEAQ